MNPENYNMVEELAESNSKKGSKDKNRKKLKKIRKRLAKVESANEKAGKKLKKVMTRNNALEIELKYERALSEEKLHRCRAETTLEVLTGIYANGNLKFPSLQEVNAVIVKEEDCDE